MHIYDLLAERAKQDPTAPALFAPGRRPMTYARLLNQVENTVATLNSVGIGPTERAAVALPDGPEMVVLFLALSCTSTCAPLNPAHRAEELDFFLADLNASALLLPQGAVSAARAVASARGIPVIDVLPETDGAAGEFTLETGSQSSSTHTLTAPDSVALLLHTSGTTSRPKMVALTHRNLVASAHHIRSTLQLESRDRCLNVMPLFHIHGLAGAILCSLAAGGSIVCTPRFEAPHFLEWLRVFRPTWYTAVPAMHQAILARAERDRETAAHTHLRFIRSSSSALRPQVMMQLEEVFRIPVIESYGMTEASHQIASNPLPPGRRKPGSVGLAAGPEIAIMDATGHRKDRQEIGEVVVRGSNVMSGYHNNPEGNSAAFSDGWFRTGDLGYLDEEGYLFLTGRSKEIINRGGEKISPREIDEVLLEHPAVAQAVAFALPDDRLGEDVGVAVVLSSHKSVAHNELQEFVAGRLADFKVPSRIVYLNELPKGPTGKVQRIGLAEKLELTGAPKGGRSVSRPHRNPTSSTESKLRGIWCEILGVDRLSVDDNFFGVGGDSVLAAQLITRIQTEMGQRITARELAIQTLAQLASSLDTRAPDGHGSGTRGWVKGVFRGIRHWTSQRLR